MTNPTATDLHIAAQITPQSARPRPTAAIPDFVKTIAASGLPCYFVSPHHNDAIMAAGALATYLAPTNPLHVINVFTSANTNRSTLAAKRYLKHHQASSANQLLRRRSRHNKIALGTLARITNLGFTDGLWRTNHRTTALSRLMPELAAAYPTYRWHLTAGRLAATDQLTLQRVTNRLSKLIPNPKSAYIFCPLGLGKEHIDSIITRLACEMISPQIIRWAAPTSAKVATKLPAAGVHTQFAANQHEKYTLLSNLSHPDQLKLSSTHQPLPERYYLKF